MRDLVRCLAALLAAAAITGCEWESPTDDVSGTETGGPDVTEDGTVSGETVATGDGISTSFSGTLMYTPVEAGTLSFRTGDGGFSLNDNGDGTLTGNADSEGTIVYQTGAWFVDFKVALDSGVRIIANYVYDPNPGDDGGAVDSLRRQ